MQFNLVIVGAQIRSKNEHGFGIELQCTGTITDEAGKARKLDHASLYISNLTLELEGQFGDLKTKFRILN